MPSLTPSTLVASGLQFPEGPVALADGSVLVVEIAAGRLTRVHPDGRTETVAETGGGPNGAAIGPDGACYLCNNGGFRWHNEGSDLVPVGRPADYSGGRIERVDMRPQGATAVHSITTVHSKAGARVLSGPNDLVFDREGGMWFTDLGHLGETLIERGAVCYAPAGGAPAQVVVSPMLTPNGIGLSPDGRTLYVAETLTARLWAFDLLQPGMLAPTEHPPAGLRPGRLLYADGCDCNFDSLAVEAGGNICIATIGVAGRTAPGGAGITVVSPEGKLVERVYLPDRGTTNLCFGGEDLRTAYVTQSRTGKLLALAWPRPGLRLHFNA